MSQRTEDIEDDLGAELDELYEPYEGEEPKGWIIEEIFLLLGFSSEEVPIEKVDDGSYGYHVILCKHPDTAIETLLDCIGFQQQKYGDLWAKEIGNDQFPDARVEGIISSMIDRLAVVFGHKLTNIHEMRLARGEDVTHMLTSKAYVFTPSLKESSTDKEDISNFLSILYKGFCEPITKKINEDIVDDIRILRHHYSAHDRELPYKNKSPHEQSVVS